MGYILSGMVTNILFAGIVIRDDSLKGLMNVFENVGKSKDALLKMGISDILGLQIIVTSFTYYIVLIFILSMIGIILHFPIIYKNLFGEKISQEEATKTSKFKS